MKKLFIVLMLSMGQLVYGVGAPSLVLSVCNKDNLQAEKQLFIDCWQFWYSDEHFDKQEDITAILAGRFDEDWYDYQRNDSSLVFLKAEFAGNLVGFIAFEMNSNFEVMIRQIAIDPMNSSLNLFKYLILSAWNYEPLCRTISVQMLFDVAMLKQVLFDLGFAVQIDNDAMGIYTNTIQNRCQMCDVLYGDDFWERPESDDDSGEEQDKTYIAQPNAQDA